MRRIQICVLIVSLMATLPIAAQTLNTTSIQESSTTNQTSSGQTVTLTAQVPRLVKFSGTLKGLATDNATAGVVLTPGAAPTNVVAVTFSLYAEQSGGAPLWSEVQNVRVDATGRYSVQLGSTKADGLPVELFSSAEAQWLGVQVQGEAEQPRVMLVSVPYALKAADAETFGGKPPSAYMQAAGTGAAGANGAAGVGSLRKVNNDHPMSLSGSGTTNYIALWTNASTLASSSIYQSANHEIGIGTSSPVTPLEVDGNNSISIVDVTQTGSSGYAIAGDITATSGDGAGVVGSTESSQGTGVTGLNVATTGIAIGAYGISSSATGVGVRGYAASTAGVNFGVSGSTASPAGAGVIGENTNATGEGFGVVGNSSSSSGTGVEGNATNETGNTFGVAGTAASPSGIGVAGNANAGTGFAIGVYGTSSSTSGVGVVGNAAATTGSAFGVKGTSSSSSGVGVYGIANSATGLVLGVEGKAESPDGYGLWGDNTGTTGDAIGVGAGTDSAGGIAVYAEAVAPSVTTTDERPIAIWGTTNVTGGIGIGGTADDGWAVGGANYSLDTATARFQNQEADDPNGPAFIAGGTAFDGYCWIDVSGDLNCTGDINSGTAVDNGTRTVALYAVEAAENWFEDAGSGRLAYGSAVVQLEPVFAQTVNGAVEYHVFVTPNGDCKGLYITNKTANSFEVRELGGGKANIAFDYRIMARRKGYENVRLADMTERAERLALRKPMQRKSTKQVLTPSPTGRALPVSPQFPMSGRPVPHVPSASMATRKSATPRHN